MLKGMLTMLLFPWKRLHLLCPEYLTVRIIILLITRRARLRRKIRTFPLLPGAGSIRRLPKVPANWDILFDGLKETEEAVQTSIPEMAASAEMQAPLAICYFQIKGRYIVTPVQSGLMLIDQKRAHERVLFDRYMDSLSGHPVAGQKSLFPELLELPASDFILVGDLLPDLEFLGFELVVFGKIVMPSRATPPDLPGARRKRC